MKVYREKRSWFLGKVLSSTTAGPSSAPGAKKAAVCLLKNVKRFIIQKRVAEVVMMVNRISPELTYRIISWVPKDKEKKREKSSLLQSNPFVASEKTSLPSSVRHTLRPGKTGVKFEQAEGDWERG